MRKSVACLSLLLAFVGAPTLARADPLTLNALSFFSFDFEGNGYRFAGDSFDLQQTDAALFFPITGERSVCLFECRPGQLIDGTVRTDGEVDLGSGPGVIGDAQFSSLTFRGSLAFRLGPQIFPNTTRLSVPLATPFLFTGVFRAFDGNTEVFNHSLRGRGTRFGAFLRTDANTFVIGEHATSFLFGRAAPTPEPSTLLLVAGGALTLGRRVRRATASG